MPQSKNKFRIILLLLLTLGLMIVLSRMWGNAFTSGDEGFTATARIRAGGIWNATQLQAEGQGRFYQLFIYPMAQIPYLFGNELIFPNIFRIVTSGITFVAFFFMIFEFFGFYAATAISAITLGLFQTVGGGYNPFHGLPLWFNVGGSILFLTFYFYSRADSSRKLWFASFLGFATLLYYESFILFMPMYVLIYEARYFPDEKFSVLGLIKRHIRLIGLVTFYLVLYVAYSKMHPSTYEGKHLTVASLNDMIFTVWTFSVHGIHTRIGRHQIAELDWRAITVALIALLGFIFSAIKIQKENPVNRKVLLRGLIWVTPLIFLPNLLFAFTERYRTWARNEPYYIGSYYSGYFVCVWLGLAFLLLAQSEKVLLKRGLGSLLGVVFFLTVYSNQIDANHFYDHSRKLAGKWDLSFKLAQYIKNTSSVDAPICTNTLIENPDPYDYWSFFFSKESGKPLKINFDKMPDVNCKWNLVYELKNNQSSLKLLKVEDLQSKIVFNVND